VGMEYNPLVDVTVNKRRNTLETCVPVMSNNSASGLLKRLKYRLCILYKVRYAWMAYCNALYWTALA